jgi:hypothetical protein
VLKNSPCYNFATDDPNEKNNTGTEMVVKTLQTIFIPSTDLWAMGNFYFSNGNL